MSGWNSGIWCTPYLNPVIMLYRTGQVLRTWTGRERWTLLQLLPDPRVFPYADFRHCVDQAMEKKQAELFMYGTDQGLPSLILLLQKQFSDYQVFARTEQFFITSGVQQALAVLALMPFPNGKRKVLLELPTYHNMPSLLSGLNVPIAGVRRTLDGMDWASLELQFAEGDIKFFYVMPLSQSNWHIVNCCGEEEIDPACSAVRCLSGGGRLSG
ncbi:hypothetical protein Q0F98_20885 [Paenibacillus amylolyticus]|nr:hypothetical protein Q0F98_20885 [Paenibacillus amylolyticus]